MTDVTNQQDQDSMVVEGALEGELDDHLGYGRHDPAGRNSDLVAGEGPVHVGEVLPIKKSYATVKTVMKPLTYGKVLRTREKQGG